MTQPAKIPEGMPPPGGAYAKYVLAVLFLVYILNFVDRQILSILNEAIRADLGLTDRCVDLGPFSIIMKSGICFIWPTKRSFAVTT